MQRPTPKFALPTAIEARLSERSYGRQRAICEDEHVLVILHAPPRDGSLERETVLVLRRPDGALVADDGSDGAERLRRLVTDWRTHHDACDKEYDDAESAEQLFRLLERLAPLNRASTNLAAALQAARDGAREDKFLIGMRDEGYEISRAFDLLVVDAKLKLDYRIAKNAEEQSANAQAIATAQHKLNVLAAITFPIMALATVLGMNLTHGLENRPESLFFAVLALGVTIGLFVKRWVAPTP
jgi:hypothetical protein